MVKLYEGGAYLINGEKLVTESTEAEHIGGYGSPEDPV